MGSKGESMRDFVSVSKALVLGYLKEFNDELKVRSRTTLMM